MKHAAHILFVVLAAAQTACTHSAPPARQSVAEPVVEHIDTLPTIIMQIQQCSRLYTTEVKVHKIVTHADDVRLKGNLMGRQVDVALPLGERKVAIPMDATLRAYIDLSEFGEHNVERDGDRITLILPDPKVVLTSSRINQQEVKEYVALARSRFTDAELSDYERQGRQAILESVDDLGIVETARENAARVLVPLVTALGYSESNVTVAFRKNMAVERLIDIKH